MFIAILEIPPHKARSCFDRVWATLPARQDSGDAMFGIAGMKKMPNPQGVGCGGRGGLLSRDAYLPADSPLLNSVSRTPAIVAPIPASPTNIPVFFTSLCAGSNWPVSIE